MHCMKCGKETKGVQAFCDSCLAIMSTKPVRPDAVVQLPVRPAAQVKKPAPRRRPPTAEEQLVRLRGALKWMSLVMTCLVLALVVTVSLLLQSEPVTQPEHDIGQNYTTVDTVNQPD